MPSVSSVELTNTFDEWRQRTNDIITLVNAATDENPVSVLVFANSEAGISPNTLTSNSVTGTLITGTRLTFTGGNVNFTSANVTSAGNVHQLHVLGGTAIDVSLPALADTSISNTFIYNSKINLNGQKFIAGSASTIDFAGATITNLGDVSAANLKGTGTSVTTQVKIENPAIIIDDDSIGSLTVSGTQNFSGATIASSILDPYTSRNGTVESSNVVANGAGFLATTNSVSLCVDNVVTGVGGYVANVGIGKFTDVSSSIASEKRPTDSKGRLHIRTEMATGSSGSATNTEAKADELVLENENLVGMTMLSDGLSNAHIMFGDTTDPDAGGILYNHATDSLHLSVATSTTASGNCAIFDNAFGGSLLIPNQETVNDENNIAFKGDLITNIAGKLHINVGASDGATGLYVDSRNATQKAISVSASQTSMNVFQINSTTLTTGSAIAIYDNSQSTGGRNLLNIDQDHADATGGIALNVKTDGMQLAKFQTTKAIATGVSISSSSGLAHAAKLLEVIHDGASTADTVKITSKATDGTQKVLDVANTSASLFTVTASNKVGINDSTPSYTLDVNGTLRTTGDANFNVDAYLGKHLVHAGDTDTYLKFGLAGVSGSTADDNGDQMDFVVGGDRKLFLSATAAHLYYDGVNKLSTISTGVDVTGQLQADRVYPCYDSSTSIFLDYPDGEYGSIQINGAGRGPGSDTWEGYSIDGRAVFMHDGGTVMGLYDDTNNHWALKHTFNGATELYYDAVSKIQTTSAGGNITGTLNVTGSSVKANGVECRLRVLNESGNLLNS